MIRQTVIRVLLSVLLLVSQQLASAHAMSHLTGQLDSAAQASLADSKDLSTALALDESCKQCLAFTQLGGPPSHPFSYHAPAIKSCPIVPERALEAGAGTILAFQSRGPPQA
ncbi:MAG: hypothetical protein V4723_07075 [Pseudomonadota bacterium]